MGIAQQRLHMLQIPRLSDFNCLQATLVFTIRLWRALNSAQFMSPLFRRVMLKRERAVRLSTQRSRWVSMSLTMLYVILPLCTIFVILPLMVLVYFVIQALSPVLVPLAYSAYGLGLALIVSGSIAREHELNTYQVLGVSPPGRLGLHWLYCVGFVYRTSEVRIVLVGLMALGVVAAFLGLAIPIIFRAGSGTIVDPAIRAAASAIFFAVDFVQTTVIAALVAMLVPAHIQNRPFAYQVAAGGFLAAQLASYVIAMLLGVLLYHSADDLIYPLLIIGTFVLVREIMIAVLWFGLCNKLNSSPHEFKY